MAALILRIVGRALLTLLLLTACVFFVLHMTGDPARLIACSDRIKSMLHWQPKYESAEQIIESAWKWQLKHPNGYAN